MFTPPLVDALQTEPVRLEVEWTGHPGMVTLDVQGKPVAMSDDGRNGDLKPADGVWTLMLPARGMAALNKPERVFRPFISYCKADGRANYNVFAEVWTSEIGLRPGRKYAVDAQETEYVVNFAADKQQLMQPDVRVWAKRFYETHADVFDFLNIVLVGGKRGNRFHSSVRNNVSGIGKPSQDAGAAYGSKAMLKGWTMFPISSFFDGGSKDFNHETAHQWINFLKGTPFEAGIPHWPKGDVAGHVMGFSMRTLGSQGSAFPYQFVPDGPGGFLVQKAPRGQLDTFNPLELYLMGLLPPKDVPPSLLLKDETANPREGTRLSSSDFIRVTIQDVVKACGPRVPDERGSQKQFRCATIVLSETLLDPRSLSFYDYFARRSEAREPLAVAMGFSQGIEKPWFSATGGRSTMVSRISGNP